MYKLLKKGVTDVLKNEKWPEKFAQKFKIWYNMYVRAPEVAFFCAKF